MEYSALRTSTSLLARLGQSIVDEAAWSEFVRRYTPAVKTWCRHWRFQEADADDVAQTVLGRLAAKMRGFLYDPTRSFRAYLKTVTRYACLDHVRQRGPDAAAGGSMALGQLHEAAAPDTRAAWDERSFDMKMLDRAAERVCQRVEPHTWEAFRLTAVEGLSGAAAAERLGINVATVFKAKSKVQKMLKDEIHILDSEAA